MAHSVSTPLVLRSITIDVSKITFNYHVKGHSVNRAIVFPATVNLTQFTGDKMFQKLVHYAALSDCIYMYNFDYFEEIIVPFAITPGEKAFFEKTYFQGLAEFRYANGIDIKKAVMITAPVDGKKLTPINLEAREQRAFVLNGGGKDGAVAMEIAKRLDLDVAWFSSGPASSRSAIVEASGIRDSFVVKRQRDEESPLERTLEGHKPMSLYVAMVSSLSAYINQRYYVIAANEYSASFPNLSVDGFWINHQYSKSFEFEVDLKTLFEQENVPVRYFSIVRPMYELQVVQLFSRSDQYHKAFISCNQGIHHDVWCLGCAKCAFVVGAMYHFAPHKATRKWGDINEVYSRQHPKLIDETIELINPKQKPFECIGTVEENRFLLAKLMPQLSLTSEQRNRYEQYMHEPLVAKGVGLSLEQHMAVNDFPPALSSKILRIIEEIL